MGPAYGRGSIRGGGWIELTQQRCSFAGETGDSALASLEEEGSLVN